MEPAIFSYSLCRLGGGRSRRNGLACVCRGIRIPFPVGEIFCDCSVPNNRSENTRTRGRYRRFLVTTSNTFRIILSSNVGGHAILLGHPF